MSDEGFGFSKSGREGTRGLMRAWNVKETGVVIMGASNLWRVCIRFL